jgi:hypothetical protein
LKIISFINRVKGLSCRYHSDLIICARALPARMTAGLSHGMPGHGAGICSGPISGSMMLNAGSTLSRSGGGARTATRSWMICGEFSTGYVSYHGSRSIRSPRYPLPSSKATAASGPEWLMYFRAKRFICEKSYKRE